MTRLRRWSRRRTAPSVSRASVRRRGSDQNGSTPGGHSGTLLLLDCFGGALNVCSFTSVGWVPYPLALAAARQAPAAWPNTTLPLRWWQACWTWCIWRTRRCFTPACTVRGGFVLTQWVGFTSLNELGW